ncbi:MAG: molybdenum cofactor guanylyltransferase [Coriobacteriales bacterium]|jgi:molybdopterin-guanine dinucleotide biosynthesis protein A|nr:molybdenum cofactor guanylyltransferase [Coriobacteriales bacterium]
MNEGLTVVIQAGGESKRMGKPKALVSFCGAPLVCRGLKRLGPIANQLIVTSNQHESLDFLCPGVTGDRLEIYADLHDVRGALNGLYTALYYARHPFVAVVACDMVFPSAALLKAEQQLLLDSEADAAVPRTSHGYEPFHAVYRRDACLPLVKEALEAGETRATSWYDKARIVELSYEDVLAADPRGGSFVNINTPEELEHIEQRVLAGEMTAICDEVEEDASLAHRKRACGYREP